MAARSCSACGGKKMMARFDGQRFTVEHERLHEDVAGLSDRRCKFCGEVVFDPDSAQRYAAAGDALVVALRL
jgi:HTH-type transcriptional regulator/antitoxin MqsA